MTSIHWRKLLAPLFLSLILLTTACAPSAPPSRYEKVQKDTTGFFNKTAVARKAEKGGKFNQFFPAAPRNYSVVPTQEKKGFAEYKLVKDGKTVAMLSINDTTSLPSAAAKFKSSDVKVAGYPAVDQGVNATAVLVNDRYQVKVLSRDTSFGKDERVDWLQKFDLRGLAKLPAAEVAKKAQPAPALKPAAQPALTAKPQPAQVTAEPAKAEPRQGFFARRQAKPEPVKAVQNAADRTAASVEKAADRVTTTVEQTAKKVETVIKDAEPAKVAPKQGLFARRQSQPEPVKAMEGALDRTADKVENTVEQTARKVDATVKDVKSAVKDAAEDIKTAAQPEKAKPKFSFFSRKPAEKAPARAVQNTANRAPSSVGNAIDKAVDKVAEALNLTTKNLDNAVNDLQQAVDQAVRSAAHSPATLSGSM